MPENKPKDENDAKLVRPVASESSTVRLVSPCVCSPAVDVLAAQCGEEALESVAVAPLGPPPLAPADAAAAFVGDSCKPNRKAFTSTAEIMAAARGWCDEHGAMPFGPRTLAGQLRRMGGQPHSNGQRRGWRGIKLR